MNLLHLWESTGLTGACLSVTNPFWFGAGNFRSYTRGRQGVGLELERRFAGCLVAVALERGQVLLNTSYQGANCVPIDATCSARVLTIFPPFLQLEGVADGMHYSVLQHGVDRVARLPSRWVLRSLQLFVGHFAQRGPATAPEHAPCSLPHRRQWQTPPGQSGLPGPVTPTLRTSRSCSGTQKHLLGGRGLSKYRGSGHNQKSDGVFHERPLNKPRKISPKPAISREMPQRSRRPWLLSFRPNPGETLSVHPEGRFQARQGAR
jgi:hypothetical protein